MATRGRPRVHPPEKSAAEIKREWDRKMRNTNGEMPGEPKRKPCVVYLSDDAREALNEERRLAKAVGLSPVLTSRLVEGLLAEHAASPLRPRRSGLPETALRQRIAESEMRAKEANLRAQLATNDSGPNVRTIRRLIEAEIARPRARLEDIEDLFRRMRNASAERETLQLLATLRQLLAEKEADKALLPRFRRLLDEYLETMLRDNYKTRQSVRAWG